MPIYTAAVKRKPERDYHVIQAKAGIQTFFDLPPSYDYAFGWEDLSWQHKPGRSRSFLNALALYRVDRGEGSLGIGVELQQRLTFLCVALAVVVVLPGLLFAQEKIPAEIIAPAAIDSSLPVLVGLKVPWQRESTLSEEAISLQRQAIHSVQDQLLSELAATPYKIVRRYDVIPAIALEVTADTLTVLANSSHVTNVLPDKAPKATHSPIEPSASDTKTVGAVPAELFAEAARAGTVLVLVGLKAPWSPEDSLNSNVISAQRKAIAAAQDYILAELAETDYRITRRYDQIPGIGLEVGLDALLVLSRSAAVTNVMADRPSGAR